MFARLSPTAHKIDTIRAGDARKNTASGNLHLGRWPSGCAIASGLAELGFKRGDRLAVVGDNRPRLYWSVAACRAWAASR